MGTWPNLRAALKATQETEPLSLPARIGDSGCAGGIPLFENGKVTKFPFHVF